MSEQLLLHHCAPTLAGMKTGSLFTLVYENREELICEICKCNRQFVPKGLRMIPLHFTQDRVLLYVYRPAALENDFSCEAVREILLQVGYEEEKPQACVRRLMDRLAKGEGFPHEIGLFLSYPPEDVRGFMENKAGGYKGIGYWKVYGDVEQAKETFARYKKCTESYCLQWVKGSSVEQLLVEM